MITFVVKQTSDEIHCVSIKKGADYANLEKPENWNFEDLSKKTKANSKESFINQTLREL